MSLLLHKFLDNIDQTNKCWLWVKGKDAYGYGTLRFENKLWKAHRLAWFLFRGDPTNLNILHVCDNPPCCNPDHLYSGTKKQNSADMVARKRHAWGEKSGTSKLSVNDVYIIRRMLSADEYSQAEIATHFGVDQSSISNIKRGETWSVLPVEVDQ